MSYISSGAMQIDWSALIQAATEASERAYAEYSHFAVGAAVLAGDGQVYVGCNVENASYGLTICAERVAVFNAIAGGSRQLAALAIYTPTDKPTPPCGACRQVLAEFAHQLQIRSASQAGMVAEFELAELLPDAFRLE